MAGFFYNFNIPNISPISAYPHHGVLLVYDIYQYFLMKYKLN